MSVKKGWKSWGLLIAGTYIMGVGTGISLSSTASGDAVIFLWDALSQRVLISVTMANYIFTAFLLAFIVIMDYSVLGIGTIICPVVQNIGIFSMQILLNGVQWRGKLMNLLVGVLGILVLSVGCGIFVFAKKGTSAYLGMGQILSGKWKQSYGLTIMMMDGSCFAIAWLLSGDIAPGPFLATVISGPVIDGVIKFLTRIGSFNRESVKKSNEKLIREPVKENNKNT